LLCISKKEKHTEKAEILPQLKETMGTLSENMGLCTFLEELDFQDHRKQRGKDPLPSPGFSMNLFLSLYLNI